jgi:hypothetical protein
VGGCLNACLEEDRRESDVKWDEPMGVGDAMCFAAVKGRELVIDGR